jgi:hypothetical protein
LLWLRYFSINWLRGRYILVSTFCLGADESGAVVEEITFLSCGDVPNFKPANTQDVIISDLAIGTAMLLLWVFGA